MTLLENLTFENIQAWIKTTIRLGKISDSKDLDLLLNFAVSNNNSQEWQKVQAAKETIRELGKLPNFIDPLLLRLTKTNSIPVMELIAASIDNHKNLQVVNTLIAVSEQHHSSVLLESAAWALVNFDLDRARTYFGKEKYNIVMAEDERDIRDLVSFTLRFAGRAVMPTRNGIGAYAFTKILVPDLVLLDVRMPRMTGYEACRLIKADPDLKDIPVVFLSAKGQEDEIQQGLDAGAEEYLLKPFAPDQLTQRIKMILAKFGK